jgi:hypothetical protein
MMTSEYSHFLSLPDLVLLDVFWCLSCEDVLYAFAQLGICRLTELLAERGAFRHICLSYLLPKEQFTYLTKHVWSPQFVRSLVLHELFCEFIIGTALLGQSFPILQDLRLLEMRFPNPIVTRFILSHSDTLTNLTITSNVQTCTSDDLSDLLNVVLPNLSRLKKLDTGFSNRIQVCTNTDVPSNTKCNLNFSPCILDASFCIS